MNVWGEARLRAGFYLFLAMAFSGFVGCEDEASEITAPSFIDVLPATIDFGRAPIDNSIRKEIIVRNTGQKTLNITGLKFRGDTNAFSLQTVPGAVPGNDKKGVILEFQPNEVGEFTASLTIESDADNNNAFEVMVRGEGIDNTLCGDCNEPPENICITDFDLEVYDLVGECEAGECKYEKRVIPCEGRCAGGACVDNEVPLLSISLLPIPTYTTDEMVVTATATDLNGDEVTLSYEWFKNQSLVSAETTDKIAASKTSKGEEWMVTVTPNDGQVDGPKLSAWTTILNSKPVIGSVSVSPSTGNESTTFVCAPLNDSDADNDSVNFTYQWSVNGQPSAFSPSIDGQLFARGDEIVCTVTPNDGEEDGLPVSSTPIVIGNSAPSIASVVIGPANPNELSTITATVSGWLDDDGDTPVYRYQWFVNSVPTSTASRIDGNLFSRGDLIQLDVTPFDGVVEGPTVRSNQLTIGNAPPVVVSATLSPNPAYTTDTLTATVSGWFDADGDAPGYIFDWYVNSSLQSASTNQLSGLSRGDQVYVKVTPYDGIDRGLWVVSSTLTISNTIPSITTASINPGAGNETTTFTCIPAGWSDADMEIEDYTYRWFVNTQVSGVTTASIDGNEFNRGDDLQCEVTPTDTINSGTPRTSAIVTVGNTPPTIVSVSITPGSGFEVTQFTCIGAGFDDQDGDAPNYDYQWYVGGAASVTGATIDGNSFDRDQDIRCDARANDGQGGVSGYVSSSTITIQNSLPTAPTATITPGNPTDADELTCSVLVASGDDDPGDEPITNYSYSWTNGSMSFSGQSVAANLVNVGETWTCTVTPNDGTADGAPGSVSVGPIRQSCVAGDGKGENCASIDCYTILNDGFSTGDGLYWIDPDGTGPNVPYQVHCLMDANYDGGGWTLVVVSSDDGQDTWTWNNRNYWDSDNTTFGSVNTLNQDFKSPAHHEVAARDLMFVHAPSGVWAGYNDVSVAAEPLATTIGNIGSTCYGTASGFPLSSGTLTQSGDMCSTELFINPRDQDGLTTCGYNNDTYGPAWSAQSNAGCPLDDPGSISALGPNENYQSIETHPTVTAVGFGYGLGLNAGTTGTGQNNMRVYVRNAPEVCSSLSFDGLDDGVLVAHADAFNPGTDSFTIETWIRPQFSGRTGTHRVIAKRSGIAGSTESGWILAINEDTSSLRTTFYFRELAWGEMNCPTALTENEWVHIAVTRDGTNFNLFLNGEACPVTLNAALTTGTIMNVTNTAPVRIGDPNVTYAAGYYAGQIDSIRWSDGVQYTQAFTPSRVLSNKADTVALWHFSEGSGGTTNDTSGNGHHGTINGATWSNICPAPRPQLTWNYSAPAQLDFTRTEVTVAQYAACVSAGVCDPANHTAAPSWPLPWTGGDCHGAVTGNGYDNHPMDCVNYQGATDFCSWVGGRLPSQTEWIAEASNGGTQSYPWGSQAVSCDYAVMEDPPTGIAFVGGCGTNTHYPVCSKSAGNSVSGLCDMVGNVAEWTTTPWPGTSSGELTVVGGHWYSFNYSELTSTGGVVNAPINRFSSVGFRCVREVRSCLDIRNSFPGATDGTYFIDPDGPGGNAPFQVYCDMTTDGGGWTQVMSINGINSTQYDSSDVFENKQTFGTWTDDNYLSRAFYEVSFSESYLMDEAYNVAVSSLPLSNNRTMSEIVDDMLLNNYFVVSLWESGARGGVFLRNLGTSDSKFADGDMRFVLIVNQDEAPNLDYPVTRNYLPTEGVLVLDSDFNYAGARVYNEDLHNISTTGNDNRYVFFVR